MGESPNLNKKIISPDSLEKMLLFSKSSRVRVSVIVRLNGDVLVVDGVHRFIGSVAKNGDARKVDFYSVV